MKNYAILNSNTFLYNLLTDGSFCSDIYDLCKNGKLTLIYNDLLLEDYLDIYKNTVPEEEEKFKIAIEQIKTFGVELDVTSIKNIMEDKNSTVYKVVPSTALFNDTSAESNNGFVIVRAADIAQKI